MTNVVQFERASFQRRVCRMTGMACMSHVEAACICKHETAYKAATIALHGHPIDAVKDRLHETLARDLIQFAKAGAPPELS